MFEKAVQKKRRGLQLRRAAACAGTLLLQPVKYLADEGFDHLVWVF